MYYKHTQPGYVTGGSLLVTLLVAYNSLTTDRKRLGLFGTLKLGGLALLIVLFSSLTVVVDREELRFYFGPGFWTRRFALENIERIEVVQNPPLYGWGIRYTPHGWLYNVSGLQAVELTVRGEGQLRIGTDEPEKLKRAVDRARKPA